MCYGCFEEYGRPSINNAATRYAARLTDKLYETEPCGGSMHIVTDDWNIKTESVWFCLTRARSLFEFWIACVFLIMPESWRGSALAIHDGYATTSTSAGKD